METLEVKTYLTFVPKNENIFSKSQCEDEHPASTVSFKSLPDSWQKQVQSHFLSHPTTINYENCFILFFFQSLKDPKRIVASHTHCYKNNQEAAGAMKIDMLMLLYFKVCGLFPSPWYAAGRGNTQQTRLKQKSISQVPSKKNYTRDNRGKESTIYKELDRKFKIKVYSKGSDYTDCNPKAKKTKRKPTKKEMFPLAQMKLYLNH